MDPMGYFGGSMLVFGGVHVISVISHGISSRSSKSKVPNLGVSHHQNLDMAPAAPALNMESSASLCLGIIGS